VISEEIPSALAGERIDRLVSLLSGCSRAEASAVIAAGNCLVDGQPATKGAVRLEEGQRIEILVDPVVEVAPPVADPSVSFEVVYEDDDIAVIDKPAGLVVHPAAGIPDATLVNGLLSRFPHLEGVGESHRPGIVHRLDRGTSGLMVVALNEAARVFLIDKLATHDVERVYDALAWGHVDNPRGTIDAPVGRSRRNPMRMTVAADGRPARTHYEVTAMFSEPRETSRLTLRLETGRTHQIRVHLASIGHPVVGDDLYSGPRPDAGTRRPFLHATRLAFTHPGSGREVSFDSPLPSDLVAVLDRFS
jgi:23S rRNA pseudouridine1911/1915/1917 synthase